MRKSRTKARARANADSWDRVQKLREMGDPRNNATDSERATANRLGRAMAERLRQHDTVTPAEMQRYSAKHEAPGFASALAVRDTRFATPETARRVALELTIHRAHINKFGRPALGYSVSFMAMQTDGTKAAERGFRNLPEAYATDNLPEAIQQYNRILSVILTDPGLRLLVGQDALNERRRVWSTARANLSS